MSRKRSTTSETTTPPVYRAPNPVLGSDGACKEANCMSGYPGVHSDNCRHSTARKCVGCGRMYSTDGDVKGWCIDCGRTAPVPS